MGQSTHKPRSDLSVIVLHWLTVAMVVTSLATGAQIATDRNDTLAGIWASWVSIWPEGAVFHLHVLIGWAIVGILLSYLGYIFRSGQWLRLIAKAKSAGGSKRWAANMSSILSLLALVGLAITGTWLFLGSKFSSTVLQWHAALATTLVIITIFHIWLQVVAGRFWALWRVRWKRLFTGLLCMTTAAVVVVISGWWLGSANQSLKVEYRKAQVSLDGVADENIWSNLKPVKITTNHGTGFVDGQTDVTVRGFHDGMSVFFLVQWADATHSQMHLPLERTAVGWRLLGAGIAQDDETEFYEDKLAMAWSDTPQLASAFTHHGQHLVPGPHRPVTRGLHYTNDGSMLDLWHWKSVRTGQQLPPRLDDNHIGSPIPSTFIGHRYTGGYQPDLGGSGYSLNVCLRDDPDCIAVLKRVRESGEYEPVPGSARQRLQRCFNTPEACESLLIPILLPKQPSNGSGMLTSATSHIWSEDLEKSVALGERVPGVVIDGRLSSGRGDVRAAGGWQDGVWTLEIRRALTTRDNKDINLMPGLGSRYLWVAPFDGSQTRHAHHLKPIKVEFQQPLN
jgi:hypothetical protein